MNVYFCELTLQLCYYMLLVFQICEIIRYESGQEVVKGNLSQFPIGKQSVTAFMVLTFQENMYLPMLGDFKPTKIAKYLLSESVSLNRDIAKYVYGGLLLLE